MEKGRLRAQKVREMDVVRAVGPLLGVAAVARPGAVKDLVSSGRVRSLPRRS